MKKRDPVVIIGAGLCGLAAAEVLRRRGVEYLLFEREDRPGGLARTIEHRGFLFDHTGHFLHFRDAAIRAWVTGLMGDSLVSVERRAWIYSHGVYSRYPFQANLFGLPPHVVRDCLLGLVENLSRKRPESRDLDFLAWNRATFGEGICRHFMVPYNEKLLGRRLDRITCDWIDRFIPRPPLAEVVAGAFEDRAGRLGYNATFLYPRDGGIQRVCEAIARQVPGILLNTAVRSVEPRRRIVRTVAGQVRYSRLISTVPLPALARMLRGAPAAVRAAARRLRHRAVVNVNFGVRGHVRPDVHWVYTPEPRFPFYRVSVPSNVCARMAPEGHACLNAEFACDPSDRDDAGRVAQAEAGLRAMGLLDSSHQIVATRVLRLDPAYVVFDRARREAVKTIQGFLGPAGILSTGRYGGWRYSSMEDALLDGRRAGQRTAKGR